jgi:hypothetical protein
MPILKPPPAPIDVVNTVSTNGVEVSIHNLQPVIIPPQPVEVPKSVLKVTR